MQLVNGFFWCLRRSPLVFGFVAVAILALGYYLQIGENERRADNLAALRAGPPAAVDIDTFDHNRNVTNMREVVLRAQPVMKYARRLTIENIGADDRGFVVPLVATDAKYDNVILGIAIYSDSEFTIDDVTPDLMLRDVIGSGAFGPIVAFNGQVGTLGSWQDLTETAFTDEGLTLSADTVIVWPYRDGRVAALTPPDGTIFGLMCKIAGVFGLLALAKLAIGNKPEKMDEFDALRKQAESMAWPVETALTAKDA